MLSLGQLYRQLREPALALENFRQVLALAKDESNKRKARSALAEVLIERSEVEDCLLYTSPSPRDS